MDNLEFIAPAAAPPGVQPWPGGAAPLRLAAWLEHRRRLVDELTREIRAGFQAVAAFRPAEYLDAVERQQALAQRLSVHDRALPPNEDADGDHPHDGPGGATGAARAAQAELRRMNAELRGLNQIQAALIEQGGRSVRCFQRVWAMAAPEAGGYADPAAGPPGRH